MIFYQACGFPTGNHGMFFKYRIEAVTLRATGEYHDGNSFGEMGRLVNCSDCGVFLAPTPEIFVHHFEKFDANCVKVCDFNRRLR